MFIGSERCGLLCHIRPRTCVTGCLKRAPDRPPTCPVTTYRISVCIGKGNTSDDPVLYHHLTSRRRACFTRMASDPYSGHRDPASHEAARILSCCHGVSQFDYSSKKRRNVPESNFIGALPLLTYHMTSSPPTTPDSASVVSEHPH